MRRVSLAGNRAFSDRAIVSRLATRPPRGLWFFRKSTQVDSIAIRQDEKRVISFYRERGFFSAAVRRVDIELVGQRRADVRFVVEEGKPTRIANIELVGLPTASNMDAVDLLEAIPLKRGRTFMHATYLEAKERLRAELVQRGHAHAVVSGQAFVDRDLHEASVRFDIDAGPLTRFGDVRVVGLIRVPERTIRARIAWRRGEVLDPMKIQRTEGLLYQLGYFSSVRVDYQRSGRPAISDVTIRVTEGSRHEIRLGAGLGVDRSRVEVRGRAGYVVRSAWDPLLTIRLDARPGFTALRGRAAERGFTGEATASIEREDFLLPRLRAMGSGSYELETLEAYSTRGPMLRLSFSRPLLLDRLLVSAGWQFRYLDVVDFDPGLVEELNLKDPYRLAFYEQSVTYDGRDQPLEPRRGALAELRLEEGGAAAGGAFRYFKITPELRGFVPIGERVVAAGRLRVGRITASSGGTPVSQRYYGGGSSGHRGFGFRRLSPMGTTAGGRLVPVGGDTLLESSVEARVDAVKWREQWVGLAAFVDGGDVTGDFEDLSLGDLHVAAGLGLRYGTPIGPLRLDVGYRLNRTGAGNPDPGERVAIHFSIGEAF